MDERAGKPFHGEFGSADASGLNEANSRFTLVGVGSLTAISLSSNDQVVITDIDLVCGGTGLTVTLYDGADTTVASVHQLLTDIVGRQLIADVPTCALLSGGRISVPGAVLGGLLVTVLNSGLLLLHVGEFWVQFFLGVLLLGAVTIDKARRQIILGLR